MIIQIGLSIVAICLAVQDFGSRSVHLLLLLLYGVMCFVAFYFSPIYWLEMLYNWVYLTVLLLLSLQIVKWRFDVGFLRAIGAGDVLFLYFSALLFYFHQFVSWVVIALIVSIILHGLAIFFLKVARGTKIPLLGYMTISLVPSVFIDWFDKI